MTGTIAISWIVGGFVGWVLTARKRGWSKVITYGGGVLFALMSLVPVVWVAERFSAVAAEKPLSADDALAQAQLLAALLRPAESVVVLPPGTVDPSVITLSVYKPLERDVASWPTEGAEAETLRPYIACRAAAVALLDHSHLKHDNHYGVSSAKAVADDAWSRYASAAPACMSAVGFRQ